MPLDLLMLTLADHWDSVVGLLTPEAELRMRTLVGRFIAPGTSAGDQLGIAFELAGLLSAALPADHPVRRAIADDGTSRLTARPADQFALAETLRERLQLRLPSPDFDHHPRPAGAVSPDEIERLAKARLLAAPALSPAQLRGRGGDPEQTHLIRLKSGDGVRLPVFQFDVAGRPLRLVLAVNRLLEADADPWGVADWWLGRNAWLDATPADLIGRVADEVLLATARAIVEGD
jgi:hypothetical protein